jgi:trehalose synthase
MTTAAPAPSVNPRRFEPLIGDPARWQELMAAGERMRRSLEGRALWSVTATTEGGIAELVRSGTALARGIGIDARWEVISGNDAFFALARRIHNDLHGQESVFPPYSDADHELYAGTLRTMGADLVGRFAPGDVVVLHGPPTAGFVDAVLQAGAHPVWRCHVGVDGPNDVARRAWRFLGRYLEGVHAFVFSRRQFIWDHLDPDDAFVVPPTLDALSPKNRDINPAVVSAILERTGLQQDGALSDTGFVRLDGTPGRVDRHSEMVELQPLPRDAPLLVHISPWNRLKNPFAVIEIFGQHVPAALGAHLIIAGPALDGVSDEPEAAQVYGETVASWHALPPELQARAHIALIPMEDADEAATIVNALQRRAQVVLQESRGEGFGMTVLEAAWKERPVVCSRVGGLQEHVVDGVTGYLIAPENPEAAGAAIARLLADHELAQRMGAAGRENVRAHYLVPTSLPSWAAIVEHVAHPNHPRSSGGRSEPRWTAAP